MKHAKRLNNINEYYFFSKLKEIGELNEKGANILNLGIGNPDLQPPEKAINALRNEALFSDANGYQSYRGTNEFRKAIAFWSKRIYKIYLNPINEILPLIGSKEGITHISQAFVNLGDEVLIPNPGYPTYPSVSQIAGATLVPYSIHADEGIDLDEIKSLISEKTKLMWINFPHMPTGEPANREVLSELIQLAIENDILLVNDNPYSTILSDDFFSIFQLEGAREVCLELNSLSKSHNMAGWRIGWVAGRSELIDIILKVKSNMDSGMYLPIQKAAVKALDMDELWIESLNSVYRKRKIIALQIIDALNCKSNPHNGGLFIWAKIPESYRSCEEITEMVLHEAGVFITPGFIFGSNGNRYIRISLCTPVKQLENALERIHLSKSNENDNKKEAWPQLPNDRPLVIAGPCSAETEEQVMETARQLKNDHRVSLFRAGVWKPRTRPGSFEGNGSIALEWMQRVKKEVGLPICTEVANVKHVYECLRAGVDVLWIGARTTANPFAVQEIADALKGVDIPVLVKNPVNPDVALWMGAIERLNKSGINKLGAIHRGVSQFEKSMYRNKPEWQMAIRLREHMPDLLLINDPSHIGGKRELIQSISQTALDLNFDGLMIETHIDPLNAWSDADQQVTPEQLDAIMTRLQVKSETPSGVELTNIEELRNAIGYVDDQILELLNFRMSISEDIAQFKQQNNMTIFQEARWNELLNQHKEKGKLLGLTPKFISKVYHAVHQESIERQSKIIHDTTKL